MIMAALFLAVAQSLALFALAPLFSGVGRVLRAKMHTRKGPSVFQDYYDLAKLFKREDICTRDAGIAFRVMPLVFLATMLLLAAGIPMATRACLLPFVGDFIMLVYLFVLPRFFFALAAIESSGAYPSVGGIRELLAGALIEPALITALFTVAVATGSANLGDMGAAVQSGTFSSPVSIVVALFACAIACYMELAKLPYDLAEAEQELQEGPLAEYSGPSLAIVKLAMSLKQIVVIGLFGAVFLPFGSASSLTPLPLAIGAAAFLIKLSVIFTVCALIENTVARVRFKLFSQHTWMVVGCAVLSLAFLLMDI